MSGKFMRGENLRMGFAALDLFCKRLLQWAIVCRVVWHVKGFLR